MKTKAEQIISILQKLKAPIHTIELSRMLQRSKRGEFEEMNLKKEYMPICNAIIAAEHGFDALDEQYIKEIKKEIQRLEKKPGNESEVERLKLYLKRNTKPNGKSIKIQTGTTKSYRSNKMLLCRYIARVETENKEYAKYLRDHIKTGRYFEWIPDVNKKTGKCKQMKSS